MLERKSLISRQESIVSSNDLSLCLPIVLSDRKYSDKQEKVQLHFPAMAM